MKILFDHNVPRKLRRSLTGHEVKTAVEMQWADIENGELLAEAELAGFFLMITGDKKLSYQQNLTGRKLALIVLGTNDWNVIKLNVQPIIDAVNVATEGSFQRVEI